MKPRRENGAVFYAASRQARRVRGRSRLLFPQGHRSQLAPEMKASVLDLYGEADTGIPVAQVEALKAALVQNNKTAPCLTGPP